MCRVPPFTENASATVPLKGSIMDLKHICLPQSVSNVIASPALLPPTKESSSKSIFCKNSGHLNKVARGHYYKHLRHQLKHRKRSVGKPVTIKNRVSIDQRPECINNKERFGDWEVDTIIGRQQKGAMLTIVERTTGMLIIKKLPKGKQAKGLSSQPLKTDLTSKNLFQATAQRRWINLESNGSRAFYQKTDKNALF